MGCITSNMVYNINGVYIYIWHGKSQGEPIAELAEIRRSIQRFRVHISN